MKALKCEMCASSDIVKEGAYFVCQICGCKYTPEAAKKLMIGIETAISHDKANLDNYMVLAQNALESKNYTTAEEYCNKIIATEPMNAAAWNLKGKVVARCSRIREALGAYKNALQFCAEEEKDEYTEACRTELDTGCRAFIAKCLANLCKNFTDENYNAFINAIPIIREAVNFLNEIQARDVSGIETEIARRISGGLSDVWNKTCLPLINVQYPESEPYKLFVQLAEKLIRALKILLTFCGEKFDRPEITDIVLHTYKNLILIQRTINGSRSYKKIIDFYTIKQYEVELCMPPQYIAEKEAQIGIWANKIAQIEKEYSAAFRKARQNKYWEEHQTELKALMAEKQELGAQLRNIYQTLNEIQTPRIAEKRRLETEYAAIQTELNSCGRFEGKKKRQLTERMTDLQTKIRTVIDKIGEESQKVQPRITSINARLKKIEEELTKER